MRVWAFEKGEQEIAMNDIKAITKKKIEKIMSEIDILRQRTVENLLPAKMLKCGYKTDNTLPEPDETWEVLGENTRIGGRDNHCWIYTEFKTPKAENPNEEFRLTLNGGQAHGFFEGFVPCRNPQCILYVNGKMVQGLDMKHTDYVLEADTEYKVHIYYYSGLYDTDYKIGLSVIKTDLRLEQLYYDLFLPYDALTVYNDDEFEYTETLKHLDIAVNFLDFTVPYSDEFFEGAENASKYLYENYYGKYNSFAAIADCTGHTHIDVAWLWTYGQTKEKVQRSFSTVVSLMKRYPEYKFMISQPQLLEFLKEEAPEMYAEVKKLISEGRIEVEGAMWVEADGNLPSGESFVRQILFGKRFIKEEYNADSTILWLPDVFGYSVALPQIMKKSGIDKFVTSKMGWNEYNKFPYDLFKWVGLDGSEVSAHFLVGRGRGFEGDRTTTYTGAITSDFMLTSWRRQQQKEYTDEVFIAFGHGDGGGGPTLEMLEMQRRLNKGVLGIPQTRMTTASESLNSIEEKFNKNIEKTGKTPRWTGELYLEFHRGTYTSVAKVKRYNRKSEFKLHNTEALSVLDMILNKAEYRSDIINDSWKTILLNQFHDVLPGSSIQAVYDDVFDMYEKAGERLDGVLGSAVKSLAANIPSDGKWVVFNPNGFEATDVINCDGKSVTVHNIPPMGWTVIDGADEECRVEVAGGTDRTIENKFYKVVFDEDFDIISIFDKREQREVIKPGKKANELIMYQDIPYSYDSWEVSRYHRDKQYRIDEVVSHKPIYENARAGFEVVKRFRTSYITQKIYLYNELDRIDFDTVVDWNLKHIMVKAAFPVDVNTNKATYEVQFGNIERLHTENTSWDIARFETCAHKWADISDNGYGMALMNDCKYGYSVVDGSTIQLSLLKSANSADEILVGAAAAPVNDIGTHTFTYSVVPHRGSYSDGEIVKKAYAFNNPMIAAKTGGNGNLPQSFSFVKADKDNIIIDTVKKAEDSSNIIIRMYEAENKKTITNISFGVDVKRCYICDLLENIQSEVKIENGTAQIPVSNFEIITLLAEI